ncbi:hypothetical protein BSL78_02073 [Apostichopus japonicus]|uniref:Uncharacterized protein n=1 Tax=Stichopus japonicus TaxID=307972 RepID=A0A2G8LLD7_STIJA|nr:hypothetical protein BSL78_02073 [Apostichopus japonicus]
MTKCRKWCIVKEEEEEIFIQVQGSSGNIPLTHKQAPHRKYSAVKGCVVYNKNKQLVKVFFKGGDTATAFDPNFFLWNAGDTSYELRPFIKDVTKFAAKLNQMVGSAPLVEMEAQVHQEMEVTPNQSSAYEWDVSGNDIPEIGVSPVIHHSTPARPRKRGTDVADLPMLFKTKKTMKESVDETLWRRAVIYSITHNFACDFPYNECKNPIVLVLQEFLQDIEVRGTAPGNQGIFCPEADGQDDEFPGHFYQPLCVIIDTLDDTTQFKENSVSFKYYKNRGTVFADHSPLDQRRRGWCGEGDLFGKFCCSRCQCV